MPKHKIIKNRINKLAKEMNEFTTQEMYDKMFYHPNNEGRLYAKRRQVSKSRLQNLLIADKEIGFKHRPRTSHGRVIWKWIGDEEE